MNKVYCQNCKFHTSEMYFTPYHKILDIKTEEKIEYNNGLCIRQHEEIKEVVSTPEYSYINKTVKLLSCQKENKDNNCIYFQPNFWNRIKKFFKK